MSDEEGLVCDECGARIGPAGCCATRRGHVANVAALRARIATLESSLSALSERVTTIADEANGPHPVQSASKSLTCIERALSQSHIRLGRLEATLKATREACSVIDEEWDDRSGDGSARALLRDIAKGEYP